MRVLRGVVYMTKSSGPRTEPWGTPQDVYQEDRSVSHFTPKQRDDRYDLNQLRTEPWIPNQDERRVIKMSWSIVSKAAERSINKDSYGLFTAWTKLNWTNLKWLEQVDPVRSLVTRVSVMTISYWLAVVKLGRLALGYCSSHMHSNAAVHTVGRELYSRTGVEFSSVHFMCWEQLIALRRHRHLTYSCIEALGLPHHYHCCYDILETHVKSAS